MSEALIAFILACLATPALIALSYWLDQRKDRRAVRREQRNVYLALAAVIVIALWSDLRKRLGLRAESK